MRLGLFLVMSLMVTACNAQTQQEMWGGIADQYRHRSYEVQVQKAEDEIVCRNVDLNGDGKSTTRCEFADGRP